MATALLRSRSLLVLALTVIPGSVVLAAPAQAAGTSSVSVVLGVLTVNSAPGAGNNLTLVETANAGRVPIVRVTEPAVIGGTLTGGSGCIQTDVRTVECVKSGFTSYAVNTGDGNDLVGATGMSLPGTVNAGDGADTYRPGTGAESYNGGLGIDLVDYSTRLTAVTVTLDNVANDGGSLELDNIKSDVEKVTGGGGADTLTGGGGNNTLSGGGGDDRLSPGLGLDVVIGGLGTDTVSYSERLSGVSVSLDGVANDGAGREVDNIQSDVENIVGSKGNDTLVGSTADNVIDGGTGADSMRGLRGTDTATYASRAAAVSVSKDGVANDGSAGEGDNVATDIELILGGSGPDKLVGSAGNDLFDGGPGGDDVSGLGGIDTMTYASRTAPVTVTTAVAVANDGEAGEADLIRSDVENIVGGSGADNLTGGGGSNRLEGRGGNDTLQGLGAADVLDGGVGSDTIGGGEGADTATYAGRTAPLTLTLDGFTNDGEVGEADTIQTDVENLTGGSGNDSLTGSGVANLLDGGLGADVFNGGGGLDTVTYSTRSAAVTADNDGTADDGVGNEDDNVGTTVENLTGGSGGDSLSSTSGPSVLVGGAGDDYLSGSALADKLVGDGGDDVLEGRAGKDLYDGGVGADVVSYYSHTVKVVASLDGVANDGAAGEGENLGATIEGITGGEAGDTLTGNAGPNELDGGSQPGYPSSWTDVIYGQGGNDTLYSAKIAYGGAGNDTFAGNWIANGELGADDMAGIINVGEFGQVGYDGTLNGGDGNDKINNCDKGNGGAGNDKIVAYTALGGPGDDELTGRFDGDAYLDGGPGADKISGLGTVHYDARTAAVNVTPDGIANDGEVGEGDNILATFNVVGGSGADRLTGRIVIGGLGNDVLTGTAFADKLYGGGGNDKLYGLGLDDRLSGATGNDTLSGGGGDDTLIDESGADTLLGGSGFDFFDANTGPVTISLDGVANDGRTGEKDYMYNDVEKISGTSGNDVLIGNDLVQHLYGESGNDSLSGLGGDDELYGGDGADTVFGGAGDDLLLGALGVDSLQGGSGIDTCDPAAGEFTTSCELP